jgi:hypothetical protein
MSIDIQTEAKETKDVKCRQCDTIVRVHKYMAPAKVACQEHKSRKADPTKHRDFDRSKDMHVLTDKADTKEVACRSCGRPCVVTRFAAPDKVACLECRDTVPKPKRQTVWKKDEDNERFVAVESFQVYDEEAFRRATAPSIPFWPDGSVENRQKLVDLRDAQERQFDKVNQIFWDLVREGRSVSESEVLDAAKAKLQEIRQERRDLRETMVAKLREQGVRNPHAEVPVGTEVVEPAPLDGDWF